LMNINKNLLRINELLTLCWKVKNRIGCWSKSYDVPYSVSPDGMINFIGPQIKRFRHAPEEVIPKQSLYLVVPEHRQRVQQSFEQGKRL